MRNQSMTNLHRVLLDAGADVSAADIHGRTAMHCTHTN
jgi:hypothetical protein